jgi:hypothetical protein
VLVNVGRVVPDVPRGPNCTYSERAVCNRRRNYKAIHAGALGFGVGQSLRTSSTRRARSASTSARARRKVFCRRSHHRYARHDVNRRVWQEEIAAPRRARHIRRCGGAWLIRALRRSRCVPIVVVPFHRRRRDEAFPPDDATHTHRALAEEFAVERSTNWPVRTHRSLPICARLHHDDSQRATMAIRSRRRGMATSFCVPVRRGTLLVDHRR